MIPTCTVQTLIDDETVGRAYAYCADCPDARSCRCSAFTITELIVVTVIFSMFVIFGAINLSGALRRNSFKGQVQEFISTMQMAASAAAESDRRYEVIIDLTEQTYMLRQVTSSDFDQVLDEEIIIENNFGDKCLAVYVLFDDLVETNEDFQIARFRAGHAGWQNGGKIVLLDEDDYLYTVMVNRLNRIVTLKEGDVELLMPKRKDEIFF